jgi:hypothetical protein
MLLRVKYEENWEVSTWRKVPEGIYISDTLEIPVDNR